MELRKDPKINLENRKGLHFNIGLCISMAIVISAFEWRSEFKKVELPDVLVDDFFLEMEADVTSQPPPPKPKPIVQPIIVATAEEIEEAVEIVLDPEDIEIEITEVDIPPPPPEKTEVVFDIVEQAPAPAGGLASFYKFLSKNIKYPRQARRMRIEGKVFMQFIIDEKGELTNIKTIKGIGGGCDEEALRVLSIAPKWNPGKQRGRPVKVRMVVPVIFNLN